MKFKTIIDTVSNTEGVFIPMNEWSNIIEKYPEIEDTEILDWQKKRIAERLLIIDNQPDRIRPIEELDLT